MQTTGSHGKRWLVAGGVALLLIVFVLFVDVEAVFRLLRRTDWGAHPAVDCEALRRVLAGVLADMRENLSGGWAFANQQPAMESDAAAGNGET